MSSNASTPSTPMMASGLGNAPTGTPPYIRPAITRSMPKRKWFARPSTWIMVFIGLMLIGGGWFFAAWKKDQDIASVPPELHAYITVEKGKVDIETPGVDAIAATTGAEVKVGDVIRTKKSARATVKVGDIALIRMEELSEVKLTTLTPPTDTDGAKAGWNLTKGRLWSRVKKLTDKKTDFTVETPNAVTTVRGTAFDNKLITEGDIVEIVTELEGTSTVSVKKTSDTKADFDLSASNKLLITKDAKATNKVIEKEDLDEEWIVWNEAQDKKEGYDKHTFTAPATPSITITDPQTELTVDKNTYEVKGSVIRTKDLSVNDQATDIGADGKWTKSITLNEGSNTITVKGKGENGKDVSATAKITYRSPSRLDNMTVTGPTTVKAKDPKAYTANGFDQRNASFALGAVTWTCAGPSTVELVCTGGNFSAKVSGVYTLTATSGGKSANIKITVTASDLTSVVLSGGTTLAFKCTDTAAKSAALSYVAKDTYGNLVTGVASATWIDDSATYNVDNAGKLTVTPGTTVPIVTEGTISVTVKIKDSFGVEVTSNAVTVTVTLDSTPCAVN